MLTKKAQDMTAALQEAITKDSAKAADLTAKVQAVSRVSGRDDGGRGLQGL